MNIDEAIEILNGKAIYFLYDPKDESPYFEKYARKKMVKFNHYSGIYANEKKEYSFEEIIEGAEEIETVNILGIGRLTTKSYAFQIVKPVNKQAKAFEFRAKEYILKSSINGMVVSLECVPFIHSCAVISEQLTTRMSPFSEYPSVLQIKFGSKEVSASIANFLLNNFLFELKNTYNMEFEIDDFNRPNPGPFSNYNEFPREKEFQQLEKISKNLESAKLPDYDFNAVKLYLDAKHTLNEEVKLILLYKVLEYFGPTVLKLETHEELGKRLSDPKVNNPDSNYISSIVELVNKFNSRKNDEGMLKEVFKICVDIEILKDELPQSIKETITTKTNISELKVRIAQVLYSTRNSIVHAKSNYELKGNECKESELQQFNIFLDKAAAQVIKWHNRLPKHQK
ncbi:MAG TPA: hypothetical protein PKA44_07895 [Saprospiraceae bacterium]|nr:hypothetical protein [Saprospiraceae bacterium]